TPGPQPIPAPVEEERAGPGAGVIAALVAFGLFVGLGAVGVVWWMGQPAPVEPAPVVAPKPPSEPADARDAPGASSEEAPPSEEATPPEEAPPSTAPPPVEALPPVEPPAPEPEVSLEDVAEEPAEASVVAEAPEPEAPPPAEQPAATVTVRVVSIPAGADVSAAGRSAHTPGELSLPPGKHTVRVKFGEEGEGTCAVDVSAATDRLAFRLVDGAVQCP
ncbi:MAG: PEGA domain-containing protein, partial [Alphaproteobacteria bacterium]|nr:PEGA domain-containing protein [Alphaproteobacteria bacterium]